MSRILSSPKLLLRLCLLLSSWMMTGGSARAQSSLRGVVLDSVTRQPLAFASVFLANTTLGVTTTEQGQFEFPKVPAGTYDVVGSYVGYRLGKKAGLMGTTPQQITLLLAPAASQLGEVVVRPNPNRAADYQKFVELFVGRTTFSRQCRIRNPDDVLVDFDPTKNVLTAASYKFVQVDNQALGYRIKYFGLRFTCDFKESIVSFYGEPVFEEMTARNPRQQRLWVANRAQAYRGSLTHFLKSVHDNRVAAEGFLAQKLRIVPNWQFPRADSLRRALLRGRLNEVLTAAENDSLNRWGSVPPAFSMLYTAPRPIDSLRRVSADGAKVFLNYTDRLRVSYLRESPDPLFRTQSLPYGTNKAPAPIDRQVSQLILLTRNTEIQPNGHLVNPLAVFTDEYWGFEKMGEFLPQNYLPPAAVPAP
ncbi:carboxypeptidase-like regulatory domain-containing protein [Hymenobacter sp. BT683]|uniref:Carboxypeptidase-like regulatory domain-containing protein n=1 Tax=Hymenobacter jeongseonensis TaxID=2791027 RepID=A0ABS0IJX8_9BACT|nr:carboxypeptidase-like regulatory domain-containing protein [Hymenobacter jeongseonensis]MBF9238163.1 carboxypeptidase-like regulatory domain-containing protein [Hymenobacter jeongseonensis]